MFRSLKDKEILGQLPTVPTKYQSLINDETTEVVSSWSGAILKYYRKKPTGLSSWGIKN
jgi:hypothetical protein